MWEWGVMSGGRSNPVGLSMTRHGAMAALSRALIATGRPTRGSVVLLVWTDISQSGPHYLRLPVKHTATHEQGVIWWS